MSMVIILFQYNYEYKRNFRKHNIFNTFNIFTMDITNNDRVTILTSEQIQMVLDDWYDSLDSSDEFTK